MVVNDLLTKDNQKYLIFDKCRKMFWREDAMGYTDDILHAGIFTDKDLEYQCLKPLAPKYMNPSYKGVGEYIAVELESVIYFLGLGGKIS